MKFVFLFCKSITLSILFLGALASQAYAAPRRADDALPSKDAAVDQYLQALKAINEKRHLDAKILLEKLIDSEPQHAGALLDLAIMQCNLGNKLEAERLFNVMVARFSPPPAILEIIDLHRASGCKQKEPEISAGFSVEKGYDSNANQGASNSIFTFGDFNNPISLQLLPEYLPKPDRYTSAFFDTARETADGTIVFLQLRGKHYDVLSNFNSVGLTAGFENQFNVKNWIIHPSVNVNFLNLNQSLYQKQLSGRLKFDVPSEPEAAVKFNVTAAISRLLYPSVKNFDGTNLELRLLASRQTDSYFLNLNAAVMQDLGNAQRLGGNRQGWSMGGFFRNGIPLSIFNRRPYSELGWQHQRWQSDKAYLSGLIDTKRYQKNTIFRMAIGFPLDQENAIQLEYRRIINHENISFLSFDSRQLQLSWQWHK